MKLLGFQQITALSTIKTLTPPAGTIGALVQPIAQNVSMRGDGTAPTAGAGMLLVAGQIYEFALGSVDNLSAMQFIEVTPSATLNVHYWGNP